MDVDQPFAPEAVEGPYVTAQGTSAPNRLSGPEDGEGETNGRWRSASSLARQMDKMVDSFDREVNLQEGQGRQDRKLAIARHIRKRSGRSEFIIAQNSKGIFYSSDESFLGTITSNLMGSKYQIWHQGRKLDSMKSQSYLMGVAEFVPTITTLAGNFRRMRVYIPKQNPIQTKTTNKTTQIQEIIGLPKYWEEKKNIADQLFSRVPYYNNITKRYELDFRQGAGKTGSQIQTSAKNFQLTMEHGRQTILQLGRVEKSNYMMDYR
ncbi:tubby-like protein 4 [Phalaenopsis equestris]|uniref:tubby-like protein 4 n=1 Tax=Phalaenopsis equestris TaxID=78828 RepID=UPI0009E46AAB|nr:tubby-like protein 4 [Phalaenopsis equestris]